MLLLMLLLPQLLLLLLMLPDTWDALDDDDDELEAPDNDADNDDNKSCRFELLPIPWPWWWLCKEWDASWNFLAISLKCAFNHTEKDSSCFEWKNAVFNRSLNWKSAGTTIGVDISNTRHVLNGLTYASALLFAFAFALALAFVCGCGCVALESSMPKPQSK